MVTVCKMCIFWFSFLHRRLWLKSPRCCWNPTHFPTVGVAQDCLILCTYAGFSLKKQCIDPEKWSLLIIHHRLIKCVALPVSTFPCTSLLLCCVGDISDSSFCAMVVSPAQKKVNTKKGNITAQNAKRTKLFQIGSGSKLQRRGSLNVVFTNSKEQLLPFMHVWAHSNMFVYVYFLFNEKQKAFE